jgi:hypothetical protein
MHSILFFFWIVFDEFIVKGREYGHKVGWTLANRVVERRNMINVYLKERACIESVRGSWSKKSFEFCGLFIFLSFSYLLASFAAFCALLGLRLFLLLDDLLEFFLAFGLLTVLHGVLDSKFKLCVFVLSMSSSRVRLRNKMVSFLVWCDELLTSRHLNLNPGHFGSFTFILICVENRVYLSHGVQVAGATWWATTRI